MMYLYHHLPEWNVSLIAGLSKDYLHCAGLHVTPALVEVVPEFTQSRDTQFLFQLHVTLLFGGQDLFQSSDFLF